ncbi:type VII secretion system-associated protein [Nocardia sp. NPDC049190]|uniref:type VII secretion system-associated protein n=1 Tax=Nocardia sp. NPDC049190 TaxID=3155650 RepID=UPI00340A058B
MGDTGSDSGRREDWVVLVDPRWRSSAASDVPPSSMMVGAWMLDEGVPGPFEPNPGYMPAEDGAPSDPIDAVLRLAADGADVGGEIVPAVRGAVVEVACDEHDQLMVGLSPDGIRCIAVVTAATHKRHVEAQRWNPVLGRMLPQVLPSGVDIMVNPGSPAQFRLRAEALGPE